MRLLALVICCLTKRCRSAAGGLTSDGYRCADQVQTPPLSLTSAADVGTAVDVTRYNDKGVGGLLHNLVRFSDYEDKKCE